MHEKLKEGEEKERMREAKENKLQENCIPREEEWRESEAKAQEEVKKRCLAEATRKRKKERAQGFFFSCFFANSLCFFVFNYIFFFLFFCW